MAKPMATVKQFEDLEVWKSARSLNHRIYTITRSKQFEEDPDLRRQIRRASVSILSNIAEGFERNNNNSFIQFLTIAKASAGEVRAQLHVCLDVELLSPEDFEALRTETHVLGERIGKFISYLNGFQTQQGNIARNTNAARRKNP